MTLAIERWVRERRQDDTLSEPTRFDAYRSLQAWVLLGDPGSGKTTTFHMLADGEGGTPVSASDFLDLMPPPEGYRAPLFIDGLDEAVAQDGKSPMGRIRSKLQQLGTPQFRLSCREADWRGSVDSDALQQLVGAAKFAELHLTPLDTAQSIKFAAHWLQCGDAQAQAFVEEARVRDLDGLLTNPQTLRMLTEAVGGHADAWPRSKQEAYARACEKLVREQNKEHLAAQRDTSHTDAQLLHAAGYLCAVMLLSGSASIALQRMGAPRPHVLELHSLTADTAATPGLAACREVMRTHLFTGNCIGNSIPVHRTVAEYLGARYLAQRMQDHLPANRVIALIQGEDGGIVPELRGLHAWLAVLANDSVRRALTDHDPLGLVLHGDVLNFRTDEKIHLLHALQQEATRYAHFRSQNWASRPFGALATPDMQSHFQAWLQSPDRSAVHQAVLDCVLDAMEHGQPMPALAPELERIVRDKTCWSGLRRSALHALCACVKKTNQWAVPLRLLDELHAGHIEDSERGLRATLLQQLYPGHISSKNIWKYCTPGSTDLSSQEWRFWDDLVALYAPVEDLPALADALLQTNLHKQPDGYEHTLLELVGSLLQALLTHFGEQTDTKRLYGWLSLPMGVNGDNRLPPATRNQLGRMLAQRPFVYKQLLEHGIREMQRTGKSIRLWLYEIESTLCDAEPPDDAADWYCALATQHTKELRQILVEKAIAITERRAGSNAALQRVEEWVLLHPEDADWVCTSLLQCPYPPAAMQQEWIDKNIQRAEKKREKQSQEYIFLGRELPNLTSAEAHLGLLVHIGETYMDFYHHTNAKTPREALMGKLYNNPHWVDMALAGLRHFLPSCTDLPAVDAIFKLHLQSRRYTTAIPCLAAMELRYAEDPSSALDLDAGLLERLVAFRLTNNFGNTPAWFLALLEKQPQLVASVMRPLMGMQIAAKVEHVEYLHALAHDIRYAAIAQRIAPTLIDALPVKAAKTQLRTIRELIACMLRVLPFAQQRLLLQKKLASPAMDVAQRVYWLTAAMQLAPADYLAHLREYVGTHQKRTSHVVDLLRAQRQDRECAMPMTLEAGAYLVELLGARFTPSETPQRGTVSRVTPAMENTRFVQQCISAIATDSSEAACQSLVSLAKHPLLKPWNAQLQQAIYEQQLLRRKALFKPASVQEVCHTLSNLQPANAADLHALAVDHLTLLSQEIRHGNTNDYSNYWDGGKPKLENDCRDRLLSDLKKKLQPIGVNAEPEGTYVDQKRADIKVIYGAWQIPVEIKRDTHKDLWKAIQDQLIAKYSREASSDGFGIYIVFWFGGTKVTSHDGAGPIATPHELQQRLTATVPKALRYKISVLVIDCSKPTGKLFLP